MKENKKDFKFITTCIPPELYAKFIKLRDKNKMNNSDFARLIIKQWFDNFSN